MIPRKMTIILMLLAAASAGAQPDMSAHDGAGVTVGTVTGQNVYIRSDHTVNAYPCAKISGPDTVEVIGQDGDWLQILPPPGLVFSVISKDYVDLPPGEQIGTVTGDLVRVYAGSDEWDLGGLAGHYVKQGHLNTGNTVVVIGEGVDYYEIAPPGGVFVWISSQFVRIGDETAEADETATNTDDAEQEDTQEPAALTEAGRQFQLVGQSLLHELQNPRSRQDLRGLLEQYQAIDVPAGSVLSIAIDRRVAYLQDLIELQDEAAEVERMAARSHARRADFQRGAHDADGPQPVAPQPLGSEFTAWGVLSPSGVYSGGAAPRRYLLRNPDTRRITAYARSVNGEVDLSEYEGRLIGVFGRVAYEADTGLNVVDVVRVEFLTPVEAPLVPEMPLLVPPDGEAVPDQPVPPVPAGPDQGPTGPPPPIPPEPILLEPDRPVPGDSPPEVAPQLDDETPSPPDQAAPPPDAEPEPDEPDESERPSVLIHPPEDEGPSTVPARPVRPSRPTSRPRPTPADDESEPPSTPSAPPAEDAAPQGPPRPDSDVAPPPAQTPQEPVEDEEQPQAPPRPTVDMHRPLPTEGLPSDEEPPAGTPSVNPDEYD